MVKTVRSVLVDSLDNLQKKSFKKFKNTLNDWEIKEGYSRIPKGKLEDADNEDVVDLIRRYYKDSYGIEVTLAVLEAIAENQEAEELRKELEKVNGSPSQEPTNGADQEKPTKEAGQGATSKDEEHFVMRNRAQLIGRLTLVAPILDDLYQNKLLSPEEYDTVRSMRISQEQMRELFRYVESWGNRDKDQFLQALRKHNSPLIRSLE